MSEVVVTGAAGMIGSNLVHGLNAIGIDDVIARRRPDRRRRSTATCSARSSATTSTRASSTGASRARELGRVDAVLHQGACSDTMEHDGRFMLDNNYRCSKDLLDACQAQGTRLLYASSAATYGGSAHVPRRARVRAPAQRLRLLEAAVRQRRAPHAAFGAARRSRAFATSTSTARASSTRAAWPRSPSTTSTSSATTGKVKLFGEYGGYAPGEQIARLRLRRRRRRRQPLVPAAPGGERHLQPRHRPRAALQRRRASRPSTRRARCAAKRPCRWPNWSRQGIVEYIDFPEALVGKYQCYTQADLTRLRARRLRPRVRRRRHRRRRYVRWLAAQPA